MELELFVGDLPAQLPDRLNKKDLVVYLETQPNGLPGRRLYETEKPVLCLVYARGEGVFGVRFTDSYPLVFKDVLENAAKVLFCCENHDILVLAYHFGIYNRRSFSIRTLTEILYAQKPIEVLKKEFALNGTLEFKDNGYLQEEKRIKWIASKLHYLDSMFYSLLRRLDVVHMREACRRWLEIRQQAEILKYAHTLKKVV